MGPNRTTPHEREIIAVVFSLKKFRRYLLSDKLTGFTDHQELRFVLKNRELHGRVGQWMCLLVEYDFEIQHKPSNDISPADYILDQTIL